AGGWLMKKECENTEQNPGSDGGSEEREDSSMPTWRCRPPWAEFPGKPGVNAEVVQIGPARFLTLPKKETQAVRFMLRQCLVADLLDEIPQLLRDGGGHGDASSDKVVATQS